MGLDDDWNGLADGVTVQLLAIANHDMQGGCRPRRKAQMIHELPLDKIMRAPAIHEKHDFIAGDGGNETERL